VDVDVDVDIDGDGDVDVNATLDADVDALVDGVFPTLPAAHPALARPPPARSRWLPTLDLVFRLRRRDSTADDHQVLLVLRWS
jgi:hypothetical protein